jgi:RNA polymerase sigma factor (sigma-70 family)
MSSSMAHVGRRHLEMLFYFSLKKTGNRLDAEELAQEIAFEAIVSLSRGHEPADFDRWLWGVARHRYAHWVEARRKGRLRLAPVGVSDQIDQRAHAGSSPEDAYITQEQLELLRRELALMSRAYREILVAYYIERKRIADIAHSLGLPEGTIKRKLHESRALLREGMEMARANGQRSYAPEQVSFAMSGNNFEASSPWPLIKRLAPKNILLEAYNNPSTIEDLSLALGIAAPYIEEEAELLTQGTLLKLLADGRYETDFVIISKEMRLDTFARMIEVSKAFCPAVLGLLDEAIDEIRSIGFHGCTLPADELYWLLLPLIADDIRDRVLRTKGMPGYTPRPGNAEWDIIGYETCELPFETFVGCNGTGKDGIMFTAFKINMDDLWDRAGEMSQPDALLVADIIRRQRPSDSWTPLEREALTKLGDRGFLDYTDDSIMTTFPLFDQKAKKEYSQLSQLFARVFTGKVCEMIDALFDFYVQRIQRDVPARLSNQVKFVADMLLGEMRMTLLRYGRQEKRLKIPDDTSRSTIAMYMRI